MAAEQGSASTILSAEDVLCAEARELHPNKRGSFVGTGSSALYPQLNALDSTALCLSGGGIRSAAFALGVIQALATHPRRADVPYGHVGSEQESLLSRFHYLSTVSGGGYIGGWLSAWINRVGFQTVWQNLVSRPGGSDTEPANLAWLRSYSNYLTPKLGAMSADTWAAAAIVGRNLVLNWLVILPVLCAVLLFLKFYAGAADWVAQTQSDVCTLSYRNPTLVSASIGFLLLFGSLWVRCYHLPSRGHSTLTQWTFLGYDLLPTVLAALFFVWSLATPCLHDIIEPRAMPFFEWSANAMIWYGIIGGMALYLLTWFTGKPTYPNRRDFLHSLGSWVAAGAIFGALIALGVSFAQDLWTGDGKLTEDWGTAELVLLVCGVPWMLASQLVAEVIFVALTSDIEGADSDREWLGRAAGWMLVVAVGWFLLIALVYLGAQWIDGIYPRLESWLVPIGGISGLTTAILGKSAKTRSGGEKGRSPSKTQITMDAVLVVAAIVFCIAVVILTSGLIDKLLFGVSFIELLRNNAVNGLEYGYAPIPDEACYVIAVFAFAVFVAWIASKSVNINRFSLHALYRNRLVRAFLGGSNPDREMKCNPFTGFNEHDNIRMAQLWPLPRPAGDGWRPFHVVNIALNIVSSKKLAWQERKAEPFTVSPLHCGTSCKNYRLTREYGNLREGISLGTAVAISGAAASPNMGYHSAPSVTFLMALLNVRLGWWLGNPGKEGDSTYRHEGPGFAIKPLLSEMFGLTTDTNKYIYLSDGGHFENLGLYEMIRRRCRLIVVSDAGCDPKFEFADLGNAVRKISLDLGVRITFHGIEDLSTQPTDRDEKTVPKPIKGPYHAIGTIHYSEADHAGNDGLILYIKPAYHGTENIGIRSYAMANPEFPHQSTGDQFFSESQFESYRALGFEIVDELLTTAFSGDGRPTDWTADQIITSLKATLTDDKAKRA